MKKELNDTNSIEKEEDFFLSKLDDIYQLFFDCELPLIVDSKRNNKRFTARKQATRFFVDEKDGLLPRALLNERELSAVFKRMSSFRNGTNPEKIFREKLHKCLLQKPIYMSQIEENCLEIYGPYIDLKNEALLRDKLVIFFSTMCRNQLKAEFLTKLCNYINTSISKAIAAATVFCLLYCPQDFSERYFASFWEKNYSYFELQPKNIEPVLIDLPPVQPISQNRFVPFDNCLYEKINDVLGRNHYCIISGPSGAGKSELVREFARENTNQYKILELYLPEFASSYSLRQVLSGIHAIGNKKPSEEDKENAFRSFLNGNHEILLLIHNFNNPDFDFIDHELKRPNVKFLITSQATVEQLTCAGCVNDALIEFYPDIEFCKEIFKKVFEVEKKQNPSEESIEQLVISLYQIPLLISATALWLTKVNKNALGGLLNELGLGEPINKVFEGLQPISFKTEHGRGTDNGIIRQNPYDIFANIFKRTVPALTEREMQVLQLAGLLPGEWSKVSDICYLIGDHPSNYKLCEASMAVSRLKDIRLLQSMQKAGEEYISLHALTKTLLFSKNTNNEGIVPLPTRAFFQNCERNSFICAFDISNRKRYEADEFPEYQSDYISRSQFYILEAIMHIFETNEYNYLEADQIPHAFGGKYMPIYERVRILKNFHFINTSKIVRWPAENMFFFEKILLYYENGIILLHEDNSLYVSHINEDGERLRNFIIDIDARNQLLNTYYSTKNIDPAEHHDSIGKPVSCSIKIMLHLVNQQEVVRIPETMFGAPVLHVEFNDFVLAQREPYTLVFPNCCLRVTGGAGLANRVLFNDGLKNISFFSGSYAKELILPSTAEDVSLETFSSSYRNVHVPTDNKYYIQDQKGFVYTKDKKHLLFIPAQRRSLSVETSPNVISVNKESFSRRHRCGWRQLIIEDMCIYDLQMLIHREQSITVTEKCLLETTNSDILLSIYPTFSELINRATEIVNKYESLINNKLPYYYRFFIDSLTIDLINQKIENGYPLLSCEELLQSFNPNEFQRNYNLLYNEGISMILPNCIRGQVWFIEERENQFRDSSCTLCKKRLSIYNVSHEKLQQAVKLIKNKYGCDTLLAVYETNLTMNVDEMLDELLYFSSKHFS